MIKEQETRLTLQEHDDDDDDDDDYDEKRKKRDVLHVDAMKTHGKRDVFVHPFLASAVYDEWPASGPSSRFTTGERALNGRPWGISASLHALEKRKISFPPTGNSSVIRQCEQSSIQSTLKV